MPHPQASSDVAETRILTDVQVAERLGVSRFTVRSWRLKGVGPRFLKMGRAVRYRSQDLDEYERQALVETVGWRWLPNDGCWTASGHILGHTGSDADVCL